MEPEHEHEHEHEQTTARHAATAEIEDQRWHEQAEDYEELPARPRRRLLSPAPLALLGVLLVACGFIGGVLVEKGQNGTSGASGGAASAFASRLRSLGGATARGASNAGGGGLPSFASGAAGGARPTSGTVSYVHGGTLYVSDGESGTIEVKTSAATTVTKTATSSVRAIHPGETVTVTGSSAANGTISAEAIRVGDSAGGLGALLGGGATRSSGAGASSSSSSSEPALFGK